MNNSKTFCLYPFTHVEIKNSGEIQPCCRFDEQIRHKSKIANIINYDIDEVYKGSHLERIRKALLKGERYSGCHRCWRDEDLGLDSHRMKYNRRMVDYLNNFKSHNDFEILSYDLKFGNTCNQMCIICNYGSSSMIAAEEKIHINFDWYRNPKIMDRIHRYLDTIKYIEFYGGEPWLIKQQWDILKLLIDKGISNKVEIYYATNGSLFEKTYFTEIFNKFKKISILYSADGTSKTFEYCRYPGKWTNFNNNLIKSSLYMSDKLNLQIGYTVSSCSIFNVIESLNYYKEISNNQNKLTVWFNLVNEDNMSIRNLPDNIKASIIDDFNSNWKDDFPTKEKSISIKNALMSEITKQRREVDWQKFINQIKTKDKLRGNSILDIIPQFRKYF